ncbi:MAG: Uma2 family endonuclease [Chloroflexota bacterium]|nr:Uma2 family endonuclease [Chloroflexota bacterium]
MTTAMIQAKMSVDDFEALANLPENNARTLQLIDGEVVEKMPSNGWSSMLAAFISEAFVNFVRSGKLGYVTGEGAGYRVGKDIFAPDVAYISRARLPRMPRKGFIPLAPDLAFEVISPSDTAQEVAEKVQVYLAHGVIVCVVYPESETMYVYEPDNRLTLLTRADSLTLPDLLPGFSMALADIFPVDDADQEILS